VRHLLIGTLLTGVMIIALAVATRLSIRDFPNDL